MSTLTANNVLAQENPISVVILAAGRGSRLQNNTDQIPKCLVEVAGQPMLSRLLHELERLNVGQIVIAVGYLHEKIREHVAEFHSHLPITFVENKHYLMNGSARSLCMALKAVPSYRHVLIVEADVVLSEGLCGSVLSHCNTECDAATLLAPYTPDLSGTFALIHKNRVLSWCHESVRKENFLLEKSYKTVNITLVKRLDPFAKLIDTLEATLGTDGENAPLEYVMENLIRKGMNIAAVKVNGQRWYEVDTPEDLQIANEMFIETKKLSNCV